MTPTSNTNFKEWFGKECDASGCDTLIPFDEMYCYEHLLPADRDNA